MLDITGSGRQGGWGAWAFPSSLRAWFLRSEAFRCIAKSVSLKFNSLFSENSTLFFLLKFNSLGFREFDSVRRVLQYFYSAQIVIICNSSYFCCNRSRPVWKPHSCVNSKPHLTLIFFIFLAYINVYLGKKIKISILLKMKKFGVPNPNLNIVCPNFICICSWNFLNFKRLQEFKRLC